MRGSDMRGVGYARVGYARVYCSRVMPVLSVGLEIADMDIHQSPSIKYITR